MSQFHFRPDDYLDLMHAEVPAYDEFQDRVAAACLGIAVDRILELGTGTGETSKRVLRHHPDSRLRGIDASADMLAVAREVLPRERIEDLAVSDLRDELPRGPFDLVVSALTIHHLDGHGKSDLFTRVSREVRPGGLFVMGDVVIPSDPSDAITPLSPDYDLPSRIDDLVRWLDAAGFEPEVTWSHKDLAIVRSELIRA